MNVLGTGTAGSNGSDVAPHHLARRHAAGVLARRSSDVIGLARGVEVGRRALREPDVPVAAAVDPAVAWFRERGRPERRRAA